MLHEFVTSNRDELVKRCRDKAAVRHDFVVPRNTADHGVSAFLKQLAETLRSEHELDHGDGPRGSSVPSALEIGRTAGLHGAEMLSLGFTIGQVVKEYGDICQAVTDLALESNIPISVDEFRTFNRCLDQATADAATAFGNARLKLDKSRALSLSSSLDTFADEHRRLVDIAIQAYFAIQAGGIGTSGATGALLVNTLTVLRGLADRNLPGIRVASATTLTAPSFATTQI